MATAVKCSSCQVCGACERSDNVRRHTASHHNDLARVVADSSGGLGRTWIPVDADHPHILVSLPAFSRAAADPNRGGPVGLCVLCGDQWYPSPGQHIPDKHAFFKRHTCHTVKPRVRKATVPAEGMAAKARVGAVTGTVVTGAHLSALSKRFPGFDLEHDDDCEVDVLATLEIAAKACDRLAALDRVARKGTTGATGDIWTAVLTALPGMNPKIAEHVRATWEAEKESYGMRLSDWEEDHEEDEDPPAPPAQETVLTLVERSAKLEAAQAATKAAVAKAQIPLEEEIRLLTVENSGVRARNNALEMSARSLASENSRLEAEITALRAALAATTKSDA
jgi:hypothetical protein